MYLRLAIVYVYNLHAKLKQQCKRPFRSAFFPDLFKGATFKYSYLRG